MRRLISLLLLAALLVLSLPVVSMADSLYIIPDSDRRLLTREELWQYQYDTLMFAFNEIYARHGYKFETGSRCYMWFTQMPWYKANESESSTNHHETYSQCSSIENQNVDLIKSVRREMRDLNTKNPGGIGMPTAPDQSVDKPRGFDFIKLKTGQKLAVYSAPSVNAFRANNGKAAVSTSGAVYALGVENGWMLILYEANAANQFRVGYVDISKMKGNIPNLPMLGWKRVQCKVTNDTYLTDDPAKTGATLTSVPAGSTVTYLTTMYNRTGWDYIETEIYGQTARGFIPQGSLDIPLSETDDAEGGNG